MTRGSRVFVLHIYLHVCFWSIHIYIHLCYLCKQRSWKARILELNKYSLQIMVWKKSEKQYFFPSTLNISVSFQNIWKLSTTSNTTLVAVQLTSQEVRKMVRFDIWDTMIKLRPFDFWWSRNSIFSNNKC